MLHAMIPLSLVVVVVSACYNPPLDWTQGTPVEDFVYVSSRELELLEKVSSARGIIGLLTSLVCATSLVLICMRHQQHPPLRQAEEDPCKPPSVLLCPVLVLS